MSLMSLFYAKMNENLFRIFSIPCLIRVNVQFCHYTEECFYYL